MRTVQTVRLCLSLSCTLALGCSEAKDDSFGGVAADTTLRDLNSADEERVCEALHTRQLEDRKDPAFVSGRCLMEAASQARWRSALDSPFTWLEACERVFEACVEARDMHAVHADDTCGPFDGCSASVGDLEHCTDSELDAYLELSEHTCRELTEDDTVVDTISERVLSECASIIACPGAQRPPDADAGVADPYSDLFDDAPFVPDPPDTLSNAEWVEQLDEVIATAARSACTGDTTVMVRSAELDDVATAMAVEWPTTPEEAGFEQDVMSIWQMVESPSIAPAIELTESFLNEEPLACLPRYGLGIAGEPGEQRIVILLLAASD